MKRNPQIPLKKIKARKTQLKVSAELNRTLRDLEKSLAAWNCAKDQVNDCVSDRANEQANEQNTDPKLSRGKEKLSELNSRESELSIRTHLLFLMLKEQIDELSGTHSHPKL